MRWLIAVAGWVLLAPVALAQDAAQKLYEAMEQKLAKAKALSLDFDLEIARGDGIKLKGALILAAGNRFKLTFEGVSLKLKAKSTMVSDGKTLATQRSFDGKPESRTEPAPEKFSDIFTGHLSRSGVYWGLEDSHRKNPKEASLLKLSGFKMHPKEKVAGAEANVIEYHLTPPEANIDLMCKLWLDVQTNLPLKRTLVASRDSKVILRAVEIYSQWELDAKLPDGTFTLPK
jgi:outer membrane lipoprotein-sorting protein